MEYKEIFTAKTVEEAKAMAVEKFGVSEAKIVFRTLQEPKKSLFGKVKQEAQVEAIYEKPNEKVDFVATAEKPVVKPTETPAEEPLEEKIQPKQEKAPEKPQAKPNEEVKPVYDNSPGIESEPVEEVFTAENLPANLKKAKDYITAIYAQMGITLEIEVMRTKSGIKMELTSQSKSGTIIGRRGETLDSIQYLASVVANKEAEHYSRLMLDSNGYREKRRKTLEQLAEKIARNVFRSGRATTLEPMNPYERRIIHSKIAEIEGVTSRSVGEDPYRKVIISSVDGKRHGGYNNGGGYRGNRNGQNRGGYQNRGGKRPYREKKPEEYQQKDLDSMKTSFERDYKKPKPEDDLNTTGTDLYGKIEL